MAERDFAEIAKLSEKYSKDPKSRIFVQLADAYRKNGMIEEALEVLNNGLQHHPAYALGHLILGKCYYDQRKFEQARDAFETTIQYDPQNIVALRMIAQICENIKDEKGQISAYKGILNLDPFDASAKEKLSHLEAMEQKQPLYTISIAQEYEKQGDLAKALEVFEHLSFTDPSDLLLREKINSIKAQLSSEAKQTEEQKIEELKVETFFRPEDVDLAPPDIVEPQSGTTETIQASELLEPVAPTPPADESSEIIELKEISEVAAAPESEEPEAKVESKDDDLDLNIMKPVESQEMEETTQTLDIITPTEEVMHEIPEKAEVAPEGIIESGDLLEPVIETEDTQTIKTPDIEKEIIDTQEPPKIPDAESVTTAPPSPTPTIKTPPKPAPAPAAEILPETPSIEPKKEAVTPEPPPTVETRPKESSIESKKEVVSPEPAAPEKPVEPEKPSEPQEKDEAASKPKEEDFKSFQDWLSGLLK